MSLKSKPLTRGPKWAQDAFNELRDDAIAGRARAGLGTTIDESADGTAVNVDPTSAGADDGGSGADNLEEITGAVNGVPSTLMVQTDGNGWTAI